MNENTIKYSSAGNLISLTMDKSFNILNLNIDESLLVREQKELLEEMIISSINEAASKVQELNKNKSNEETEHSNKQNTNNINPFNMNWSDMNQMFSDISKRTVPFGPISKERPVSFLRLPHRPL